jgi:hypothetical protein
MAKKPVTENHAEIQDLDDAALDGVTGGTTVGDEVATDVVSPRDPASGLPTGKRMHKPFVII